MGISVAPVAQANNINMRMNEFIGAIITIQIAKPTLG